jgi:hypothetical protein
VFKENLFKELKDFRVLKDFLIKVLKVFKELKA